MSIGKESTLYLFTDIPFMMAGGNNSPWKAVFLFLLKSSVNDFYRLFFVCSCVSKRLFMGRPENIGIVIFVVVVVYMFVNEIHVNILVTKGLYGIKIKTFPKLYRGFFSQFKNVDQIETAHTWPCL